MKSLFDSSSTALLELCALPIPTGFSSFASASGDNSFGVFEDAIELFEGKQVAAPVVVSAAQQDVADPQLDWKTFLLPLLLLFQHFHLGPSTWIPLQDFVGLLWAPHPLFYCQPLFSFGILPFLSSLVVTLLWWLFF